MDELNTEMHAVSADLYSKAKGAAGQQPGAEQQPPQGGPTGGQQAEGEKKPGAKPEGEVIDADFEMVDDKKKK